MNTKINILLIIAAGLTLMGCNRDEKDLFSDSANTRLQKALDKAENAFVSAENGWEMLYFPNTASCGYNLLVRFNENGQTIVAASNTLTTNDRYTEDGNSTWAVKADYGPLLSFDTYNRVLHAWADPQTDGDGYLGDYEFLILNAEPNQVRLKGKKHEAYTEMFPLEKGKDWRTYFKEVQAYRDLLFTGNDGMKVVMIGGGRELNYVYEDGIFHDPDSLGGAYYPLIVRPNCIQLYDTGFCGGVHFALNETMDKLICTDEGKEGIYILPGFTPTEYFVSRFNQKEAHWIYQEEGSSSDVVKAVNAIKADAAAKGATITRIALDKVRTSSTQSVASIRISYLVSGKLFEGYIPVTFTNKGDQITFAVAKVVKHVDLQPLLLRIASTEAAGVKRFTDIFCDTYTVSSRSGSQFNMLHMNIQSSKTAGKNIHVVSDKETI